MVIKVFRSCLGSEYTLEERPSKICSRMGYEMGGGERQVPRMSLKFLPSHKKNRVNTWEKSLGGFRGVWNSILGIKGEMSASIRDEMSSEPSDVRVWE